MAVLPRAAGQSRPWTAPRRGTKSRAEATRLRVLWLLAVALLLAAVIWGRLAYWQIAQHQKLAAQASAYHAAHVTLPAARGLVYDRDGLALAVNTTVYDLTVAPDHVRPQQRQQGAGSPA